MGQNFYDWVMANIQPVVLVGIGVIGVFLLYKREFTKLLGFLAVAFIAVGFVFAPNETKDALLSLYKKLIDGVATGGEEKKGAVILGINAFRRYGMFIGFGA